MDKLRIPMIGQVDSKGNEYYMTTCEVPLSVDLSNSVIHVFPSEDPDDPGKFRADLVIRKYDKKGRRFQGKSSKRSRNRKLTESSSQEPQLDPVESDD